uniref:Uncharacterized protein n=1 Tax=Trypanosoma vivax (strain Y486) TaxID=1055687 RepID=G0TZZ5_TRYVY|nr:hypothetical protein TVY486_0807820 [Trypanosoma vivax Y486]
MDGNEVRVHVCALFFVFFCLCLFLGSLRHCTVSVFQLRLPFYTRQCCSLWCRRQMCFFFFFVVVVVVVFSTQALPLFISRAASLSCSFRERRKKNQLLAVVALADTHVCPLCTNLIRESLLSSYLAIEALPGREGGRGRTSGRREERYKCRLATATRMARCRCLVLTVAMRRNPMDLWRTQKWNVETGSGQIFSTRRRCHGLCDLF